MEQVEKVALVTGASRGIGAEVARLLAQRGMDIVLNYRSKAPRAEAVATTVRSFGRRATLAQADLTSEADRERMASDLRRNYGRLDLLVLNASGGMEKDKPATYAMNLNLTAQVQTVGSLLPSMPPGSTIIFVTSHWAHFYGQQQVLAAYEPVAQSKKAGEDALRARMPEFTALGVRLLVVSGDVIEGTITPKLLNRAEPGVLENRKAQVGALPTVESFAQAIVEAALDGALAHGAAVYVGSTE